MRRRDWRVMSVLATLCVGVPSLGLGEEDCFPSNDYLTARAIHISAKKFYFGSGVMGPEQALGDGLAILSSPEMSASGSGFLVGKDGSVLTNWHVAKHMIDGEAKFDSGARFPIRLIKAYSIDRDLAMLKIVANQSFPTVVLGDSNTVEPRDDILAIGSPLGRGINMTEGNVSQVARDDHRRPIAITHTAIIQGGNSGGPLFRCGEVIGVNTAMFSDPRGGSGLSIAVPINDARSLLAPEYFDKAVALSAVFDYSISSLHSRAQHLQGWTGTVPAGSPQEPGTVGVEYALKGLDDYLIQIEAPPGVDLNLGVVDGRGELIGLGATLPGGGPAVEPLLLSISNSQPVAIVVANPNARASNFGLAVYRIAW